MEFNPVVVRKNSTGVFPPYQPTLSVPKKYKDIVLEWDLEKHVAVVTLNRPDVRNALSVTLMEETIDALHMAEEKAEISCVILRPAGEHFCAGGDFNDFTGKDLLTQRWYFQIPVEVLQTMLDITVPVIGAVRGAAWAFGCAIAAGCDLTLASESAQFCLPGGRVGFGCLSPIVAAYKPVLRKRAFELLVRSEPMSAQWACESGLVNKVVPDEELDKEAWAWAKSIGEHAPLATRWEKQVFNTIQDMEHHKAYRFGADSIVMNSLTGDGYEGQTAFLEKRKPMWKGRKGGGGRGDMFQPEEEHRWNVGDEEKKK
ncbi:MAG: enoyl-CoA hydratase-related protein [Chloroflexota bacterium]|nr:enoyl-CoA hydratase-related protein [Chloroflexota bacterium]